MEILQTNEINEIKWYQSNSLSTKKIIFALIYYFFIHLLILPITWVIVLTVFYDAQIAAVYAQAVSDVIGLFVFLVLFLPVLEESFHKLKNNIKFTLFHSTKWYIPMVLSNALISYLIILFTGLVQSSNQDAVIQMFDQSVLSIAIPSLLVAPLVEELIFRGTIYRGFRKYGAVTATIISSLAFGLLHVVISLITKNYADLIFIIPYSVMAMYFCLAYEKTKNIFGCYALHLLNNLIAMLLIGLTGSFLF